MSHENSKTILRDGRYVNVNGVTGELLKPLFRFERESYSTLTRAVRAARLRSRAIGAGRAMSDAHDRHPRP